MEKSILSFIPTEGDKKPYRLQISTSLAEATELDAFCRNKSLPFDGDLTLMVRTILRYGISGLAHECDTTDSFIQSFAPIINAAVTKWTATHCDDFACASVDHMLLTLEQGDTSMSEQVVNDVADILDEIKHPSSLAMVKRALQRRGFIAGLDKLRNVIVDEGGDTYWLDTLQATTFR